MEAHRESCRRQHRVLGHFLAVQAWLRGLDCIVLERRELETFLGLRRFKSERVKWLRADLKPWFPFQEPYYKSGAESSLHSLFLARVEIQPWLPDGSMTTAKRIQQMPEGAPNTEMFSNWKLGFKAPTESDMVRYLAILDSGLASPEPLSNVPVS
jgi:hypothetical protein